MKKSTILCVMAMLWPISSKDKGVRSKDKRVRSKDKGARSKDKRPRLQKYLLIALVFGLSIGQLVAQEIKNPLDQLMIGDKLPETFWQQEHSFLSNGKISKGTLEQNKGKVILIDFWASWCSSCRLTMPKVDSLERVFAGQLVTIPVVTVSCNDKVVQIERALKDVFGERYANIAPVIIEDTYLDGVFPHRYLGHYILIGRHGRISAMITSDLLTESTIKQVIDHTKPLKTRNGKNK